MKQAIVTKYLGPTNHRGARVKASCQSGSIMVPWDHEFDVPYMHKVAAIRLANKLGWEFRAHKVYQGGLPDNKGYAFVFGW